MSAVFDASVVVKWFARDPLTDQAKTVREAWAPRFAPSLLTVEVANALRRYVVGRDLDRRLALQALDVIPHIVTLVDHRSVLEDATSLAITRNHSVQDCLYAVVALRRGLPLVTADQKLARKFADLEGLDIRLIAAAAPDA